MLWTHLKRKIKERIRKMSRRVFAVGQAEPGESSRSWAEAVPPSPWAPLKKTTSLTNLKASPLSPSPLSPSPSSLSPTLSTVEGQSPTVRTLSSNIWSSLCCWKRKETYGKIAWREVQNLSSQLVELKQQNAALRTNQGKLIKEVKRLQSLWETKEMEDCALKNEVRHILSILSHQRTGSTEATLVCHSEAPPSESNNEEQH